MGKNCNVFNYAYWILHESAIQYLSTRLTSAALYKQFRKYHPFRQNFNPLKSKTIGLVIIESSPGMERIRIRKLQNISYVFSNIPIKLCLKEGILAEVF